MIGTLYGLVAVTLTLMLRSGGILSYAHAGFALIAAGEFTSTDQLADRIIEFIKAYNRQAKPFRWTYDGRPLKVA